VSLEAARLSYSDAVEYFWLLHHNVKVLLIKSVYLLFMFFELNSVTVLLNMYNGKLLLLNWLRLLLLSQRLSLFYSRRD
jgi:hypothetical protein